MRRSLRSAHLVLPLLALVLFLAGCPKRPATSGASATAPSAPAPTAAVRPAPVPAPTGSPSKPVETSKPATPPKPSEFVATDSLKDIHFDFDKYEIRPGDARILEANAAWLKTHTNDLVLIEGHCDERGTNEYNLALGGRRAKATMNYLLGQGVQTSRITLISYGQERPNCVEHNEACWAKNRRAHFLVKAQ